MKEVYPYRAQMLYSKHTNKNEPARYLLKNENEYYEKAIPDLDVYAFQTCSSDLP